jgi:tRNA pseudouridine55 synthase
VHPTMVQPQFSSERAGARSSRTATAPVPARGRVVRRAVHGVLLLDKPLGMSSNQALQAARRLYRAAKAGHTGTLDPLASGLLPLCFGAATKFSQPGLDADKRYLATLRLGVTTTTGDGEGDVIERRGVDVDRERLQAACGRLTGALEQVPPMHSALKHAGRALYEYARAGLTVERAPRRVQVHEIDVVDGSDDVWRIAVRCSKGTYIRVLAEDIGRLLGCGAHLESLRRTASGALDVHDACTLDTLADLDEAGRDARLLGVDALIGDCPVVRLDAAAAANFLVGMRLRLDLADAGRVRVYGPQEHAFLGAAHIVAGELIGDRLLSPTEVAELLEVPA